MGGGNGQKAKMAREKNLEKMKPPKGSQLESNKKAMNIQSAENLVFIRKWGINGSRGTLSSLQLQPSIIKHQCKVCMQTFMSTTSEVKCKEHAEAKHPKSDLYTCFPHLKK